MIDLDRLNSEQRRAVEHDTGPILVLAGAGSGKTRVITTRIAYLVQKGVRPENLLGVTFTNKAAAEMRERVAHLIRDDASTKVTLGTFHSLGAQILRRDIHRIGYHKQFTILDEADKRRLLRDILKEVGLAPKSATARRVLSIISKAKNAMTTPARLDEARYNPEMPRAQRLYSAYQEALVALNAVDFDDLLLLPVRLFREHPDVRERYRQRFRYTLVDEFQDTNPIQLALLQELVGPPHSIMAVGDDDQSIYAFRGAVADNILHFGRFFPNPVTVALEQNYRSVGAILDAANAVIAHNAKRHPKQLWSALGDGRKVLFAELDTDVAEADWIARRVQLQAQREQRPYDEFAILYRSNGQASTIEEALRQYDIDYRLLGGQSVFDRREVKDALAYFRLLVNPRDEMAIRRVINTPNRGVGTTTLAKWDKVARAEERRLADVLREATEAGEVGGKAEAGLRELFDALDTAKKGLRATSVEGLPGVLRKLLERVRYEQWLQKNEASAAIADVRWRIVNDMIQRVAEQPGESAFAVLDEYVQKVTLNTNPSEGADAHVGKVVLSTLHSSKGLEFPVVYMVGMNEGTLPHENALKDGRGAEAEERRLCYVGMTRAKQSLVLCRGRNVIVREMREPRERSRFIDEIPLELLRFRSKDSGAKADAQALQAVQSQMERMRARLRGEE